jgi:hypothetical protein
VTVYSQDGSRKVVRERSGGHRGFGPTVGQVDLKLADRLSLARSATSICSKLLMPQPE